MSLGVGKNDRIDRSQSHAVRGEILLQLSEWLLQGIGSFVISASQSRRGWLFFLPQDIEEEICWICGDWWSGRTPSTKETSQLLVIIGVFTVEVKGFQVVYRGEALFWSYPLMYMRTGLRDHAPPPRRSKQDPRSQNPIEQGWQLF